MKVVWLTWFICFMPTFIFAGEDNHIQVLKCNGNLDSFVRDASSKTVVNFKSGDFKIDSSHHKSIYVGLDKRKPFWEVFPWDGIHYKDNNVNYEKAFELKFHTDGETTFEIILVAKKTRLSKRLICSIASEESL